MRPDEPHLSDPSIAASFPSSPAWEVTSSGFAYMHARQELREFVQFYHETARLAVLRDPAKADRDLYEKYHGLSSFFVENYVCRMSDGLDRYLESITAEICLIKPDFLPISAYDSARRRLERYIGAVPTDYEVVNEAAKTFCARPKVDIEQAYSEKLGFNLLQSPAYRDNALLLSAIRNAIVHADAVADYRLVGIAAKYNAPFDILAQEQLAIPEGWAMRAGLMVDELVFSIDHGISDVIAVHKNDRRLHFWMRRASATSSRLKFEPPSAVPGDQVCPS